VTAPRSGRLGLVPAALSSAAALLAATTSLLGLFAAWPYAAETAGWRMQAHGQDLGNLLAVVVLLAGLLGARRGSARGFQVWAGALVYLAYAFVIYAMTVHFTALFLAYVAVLGLSVFGLLCALAERPSVQVPTRTRRLGAGVLGAIAVAFALLWLSTILGALAAGRPPAELAETGLPANPVHVLDLAVVLPGMLVVAIRSRRGGLAVLLLAPLLVFAALMAASIVVTLLLGGAPVAVVAVLGAVTLGSAVLAGLLLREGSAEHGAELGEGLALQVGERLLLPVGDPAGERDVEDAQRDLRGKHGPARIHAAVGERGDRGGLQ